MMELIECNNTDVFVLLLHHYQKYNLNCTVRMEATYGERNQVKIKATIEKHTSIVLNILAARSLSLSDTKSQLHRIGKTTVLNVLKQCYHITELSNTSAEFSEVLQQAAT